MNSINHDVTTGGGCPTPAPESVRSWSAAVLRRLGARAASALVLLALPAFAVLPEPGARIYGSIALNGVVVTAANTGVIVEARRTATGLPVASYPMGSQTNAGNFYSLRIQGADIAPLSDSNNVALGSTLFLVVRDGTGVRAGRVDGGGDEPGEIGDGGTGVGVDGGEGVVAGGTGVADELPAERGGGGDGGRGAGEDHEGVRVAGDAPGGLDGAQCES